MNTCRPATAYHMGPVQNYSNRRQDIYSGFMRRPWWIAFVLLIILSCTSLAHSKALKPLTLDIGDGVAIQMGHAGKMLYWKIISGEMAGAELQLTVSKPIIWASFSQRKSPQGIIVTTKFKTATGQESTAHTNTGQVPALFSVTLEPSDQPIVRWSVYSPWADRIVFKENGRYGVVANGSLPRALPDGVARLAVQKKSDQSGIWLVLGQGTVASPGQAEAHNKGLKLSLPFSGRSKISLGAFKGDSLIAMEQAAPALTPLQEMAQQFDALSSASPKVQKWSWFSDKGRLFAPLEADPREAAFHLGFMQDDDGETFEDVAVGGDLGILHLNLSSGAEMSLTMRGLLTARFDVYSNSFDLLNADFLGGPALGYRKGEWSWEAFAYHQSSHLGDEVIERGERRRIDYGREVIRFLGARSWDRLRLYAGPSYVIHSLPKSSQGDWTFQAGLEYGFRVWDQPCFAATDIQTRQENDWNLNLTARVGVDLGNPHRTQNRQYLFLELFQGYSNMGQYYDTWERYAMLGIGYNFR